MKINWKRLGQWAKRQARKPVIRKYGIRKLREWWRKRQRH